MQRRVIFNADDFGASQGINCGIVAAHERGVVTSTSLMVNGAAARDAAAMSRDYPATSVGLHWDVCGEDERHFDLSDHAAVREEFARQVDQFHKLMDRLPTHVDSHRRPPASRFAADVSRAGSLRWRYRCGMTGA